MSDHLWAEVDALNIKTLRWFEDGRPHAISDVRVGQSADLVRRAITELTALGYLKPGWNGTYTITLVGQGHLATQKVTA